MSDDEEGRVFLSFCDGATGPDSDEILHPFWSGSRQFLNSEPHLVPGPDFNDASEAVHWWLDQGDRWIVINLDGTEYLWAGVGAPPRDAVDEPPLKIFSHDDPRGRPEGALAMAEQARLRERAQRAAERIRDSKLMAEKLGRDLTMRRDRVRITVEELANRIGVPMLDIEDIEAGRTSLEVEFSTWLDIVWATREPFPDPRRSTGRPEIGTRDRRWSFVGNRDLYLAEEHVRRALEDDWPGE